MPLNYKIKFVHRKKTVFLAIFAVSIKSPRYENSNTHHYNSSTVFCAVGYKGTLRERR